MFKYENIRLIKEFSSSIGWDETFFSWKTAFHDKFYSWHVYGISEFGLVINAMCYEFGNLKIEIVLLWIWKFRNINFLKYFNREQKHKNISLVLLLNHNYRSWVRLSKLVQLFSQLTKLILIDISKNNKLYFMQYNLYNDR